MKPNLVLSIVAICIVGAAILAVWVGSVGYAAGLQAGEWKGKAETMESIMGTAAYNLGSLQRAPTEADSTKPKTK